MMLEVVHQHEKLAPKSGIEFMEPISGACVRGLREGDAHPAYVQEQDDTLDLC